MDESSFGVNNTQGWIVLKAIVAVISFLMTILLSKMEATISSVSRSSLLRMDEEGLVGARRMLRVYQPRDKLGLTVRIARTLLGTVAVTSTVLLAMDFSGNYGIIWGIVLAGLFLVLCENIPYRLRKDDNENRDAPKFRFYFYLFHFAFAPFARALSRLLGLLSDEVDYKAAKEEELRTIVETESEEGVIEEDEKEMIEGIFEFYDTTVKGVMVPRVDMVAAECSLSLGELLVMIKQGGHSRVPVYREKVDNVEGVVYAKDLLYALGSSKDWSTDDTLEEFIKEKGKSSLIREAYYVPENKKIDELLRDFKREKRHMAIVVDEYGGVAGLVTLEDLLEEIVGEIEDEYDEEKGLIFWDEKRSSWIVDAKINIHNLNETLNSEIPSDSFGTLGGFIYDYLGHIPDESESFEFNGLKMWIEELEGQRISKVKITKIDKDKIKEGTTASEDPEEHTEI